MAWTRMRKPRNAEIEDRITFRLAGRLQHDSLFAEIPYDVVPQRWLLGLNGERLGRLDLCIKHRNSHRDYFVFEAKRLRITYPGGGFSTEYPTYTGDSGMMAFVEGQYAPTFPVGGMLGYVMDGLSDIAWTGLAKRIEAVKEELQLSANTSFERSALAKALENTMDGIHLGETQHTFGKRRFRLLHLLLPRHSKKRPSIP